NWKYNRFGGFTGAVKTDKDVEQEKAINAYRAQIVDAFQPFDQQIRNAETIQEKCEALYTLMEYLQIPAQLDYERTLYDEAGKLEKAREHEQVWNGVIQLMDEAVEMVGNEKMSMTMFFKMFTAGLEALEFSHVPPSMDHVI